MYLGTHDPPLQIHKHPVAFVIALVLSTYPCTSSLHKHADSHATKQHCYTIKLKANRKFLVSYIIIILLDSP